MRPERAIGARGSETDSGEVVARLQRRLEREHAARHEAERLLERTSLELFALNQQLMSLNSELETQVATRTLELEAVRASTPARLDRDWLTGVCSRTRYSDELESAVAAAVKGSGCVGLLVIDLDDFKVVNDTHGHSLGDDLLCAVAGRLREIAREEDIVARIGGDEFAVIIPGHDPEAVADVVQRYRGAFDQPFALDGLSFKWQASLGYAVAPQDAASSVDLQRFADLALNDVKNAGGNAVTPFKEELRLAYEEQRFLKSDFILAVEQDEVEVCFQPILNLVTSRIDALETLARWRDRRGKAVGPAVFIDMAEKSGQIIRLSQQLLRKALIAARPWVEEGLVERLTFNISPVDLLHPGFVERITTLLAECAFPSDRLVLEITEGVLLGDLRMASEVMEVLSAAGVLFALDDFGSGYSNLLYLRHLPLAALKLDRSLVQGIASDGGAMAIVRNLIALCNDLDIRAISEGVESEEQARTLLLMSCEYAQGFLFPGPFSAAEADAVLR